MRFFHPGLRNTKPRRILFTRLNSIAATTGSSLLVAVGVITLASTTLLLVPQLLSLPSTESHAFDVAVERVKKAHFPSTPLRVYRSGPNGEGRAAHVQYSLTRQAVPRAEVWKVLPGYVPGRENEVRGIGRTWFERFAAVVLPTAYEERNIVERMGVEMKNIYRARVEPHVRDLFYRSTPTGAPDQDTGSKPWFISQTWTKFFRGLGPSASSTAPRHGLPLSTFDMDVLTVVFWCVPQELAKTHRGRRVVARFLRNCPGAEWKIYQLELER